MLKALENGSVRLKQWITQALRMVRFAALYSVIVPIEYISRRFITYHARPKYARDVHLAPEFAQRDHSEYAVVVQGPLYVKNRLTVETLLLYKKLFPGAMIILSTWDDTDPAAVAEARQAGVEVVISEVLKNGGPLNIVSGSLPPPCRVSADRQDTSRHIQYGSHIWSTI
jgi:hypothetical protein